MKKKSFSEIILSNFETATKIVASSSNRPNTVNTAQLVNHLTENSVIFSNDAIDIVLVYIDSVSDRDLINTVGRFVDERTGGKYIAVYTADNVYSPPEKQMKRRGAEREEERDNELRAFDTAHWWPRQIWEGLFVTLLLITIFGVGLWCTFELQVPSKWEKPKQHMA
jgi:hypothetical protein